MRDHKVRRINVKKLIILIIILLLVIAAVGFAVYYFFFMGDNKPKGKMLKFELEEKVDVIDTSSKTRPLAVSINNTPVAIKVQTGLNKAFIVYEIPTEGSTARVVALFKDVDDLRVGTIRSARHNMIDYAYESDAIFVAFGWSHYAQDDLQKKGIINYVQGMVGEGNMWRENPAHLDSEHTVYLNTNKVYEYARDKKGYSLESDDTVLLNYNVIDVDLSNREEAMTANKVTIPYGSVTNVFEYNPETKMYTRIVNDKRTTDYYTGEEFTTKNIIVQKVDYNKMDDGYYWNIHTTGEGNGFYITNGKAVPIKWSKADRKAKTKYTYEDGDEIDVSDGRTYIEVQVKSKSTTIE